MTTKDQNEGVTTMMGKNRINRNVYNLLVEAFRRFECFGVRRDRLKWTLDDIQKAWTGLGTPSVYKPATSCGFMKPLGGKETPRITSWYLLTEKGARIILAWHDMGFECKDYEAPYDLPDEFDQAKPWICPECGSTMEKVKHRSAQNPMQWFGYHYECKCGHKGGDRDVGL